MSFTKFTSKRVYWLATGFILLVATVVFSCSKDTSSTGDSKIQPYMGEWEVTEFTGFINYEVAGGSAFCDPVNENYYPIIDNEQTFIKFFDGASEAKLKNIPKEVYDTLNVMDEVSGLFIFQFSFDNGYETNAMLESFNVPYHYTEVIKGLWTFEAGLWTEVEGLMVSGPHVYGEIISGTKWGGKSSLKVVGQFINNSRIEGQWEFKEVTAGPGNIPECDSKSYGSGKWVAIKN